MREANGLDGLFDFGVLRGLRRRQGLTIAEVSERSGVSPAVISKLERNQTRSEIDTLFRLSRVFGVQVSELLGLAERRTSHRTAESAHESDGFRFRQISYANVRCLIGEASAGGWASRPDVHADDFELCWCIEGEVVVLLPGERHCLTAGEALQFDAVLQHRYEAVSDCRIVVIHITKQKRF